MDKVVVGQLAVFNYRKSEKENASWMYIVVKHIFDDRIEFYKEDGGSYMHIINTTEAEDRIIDNQPTDKCMTLLYRNGNPVMSKKNIFGKYTFKPKN